MTPQDNSDASLLVYADYLLDQGREEESAWVRESINESPRKWEYQWHSIVVSIGGVGGGVGGVGGGGGGGVGGGVGGVGGGGVGIGGGVGGIGGVGGGVGIGGGVGGGGVEDEE